MNKPKKPLTAEEALSRDSVRPSYNYCGICGRTPQTHLEEPNYAPLRWWDPDDGWKVGTLCRWCHEETFGVLPKPEDFAYPNTNGVMDNCDTDEDPLIAIPASMGGAG